MPRKKTGKKKTPRIQPITRALHDADRMRLPRGSQVKVADSEVTATKRGVQSLHRRARQLARDMELLERKGKRPLVTADILVRTKRGEQLIEGVYLPLPSEMGGREAAAREIGATLQRAAFQSLSEIQGDSPYSPEEEGTEFEAEFYVDVE